MAAFQMACNMTRDPQKLWGLVGILESESWTTLIDWSEGWCEKKTVMTLEVCDSEENFVAAFKALSVGERLGFAATCCRYAEWVATHDDLPGN